MKINLRREINLYYFLETTFEIFRTHFHAIYSLYLIHEGLTLGEISLVKIGFFIAIIVLEIPFGLLADLIGQKSVFTLSTFFAALSFVTYILSNTVEMYFVAEFIYGTSMALYSGSLDSNLVNTMKKKPAAYKMIDLGRIFSKAYIFTVIAMLFSGFLGSYLYTLNIQLPWIISAVGMLSLFLYLIFNISHNSNSNIGTIKEVKERSNFIKDFKLSIKIMYQSQQLIYFLVLLFLFQAVSQPVYQYWAVLFESDKDFILSIGTVFILMHLFGILGGIIRNKINLEGLNWATLFIPMFILSCSLILTIVFSNMYWIFLCFIITQICRGFIFPTLMQFQHKLIEDDSHRSAISSILSSISNIGAILVLYITSILINNSITEIWSIMGIAFTVSLIPIYILIKKAN